MKKILGLLLIVFMVAGCGKMTDEAANKAVLDSLENAYITAYMTDGVGLAVFADQKVEKDGTWYKVADETYKSVNDLKKIASSAFKGDVLKDYETKIESKYMDINNAVYTKSESGCAFPYFLEEARGEIEKIITITSVKSNKIKVKVNNKEYQLVKKGDNWLSEEKIFMCE